MEEVKKSGERPEFALNAGKRVLSARKKMLRFRSEHWGVFALPASVGGIGGAKKLEDWFDLGKWEEKLPPILTEEGKEIPLPPGLETPAELLGFTIAGLFFIGVSLLSNFLEKRKKT